MQNHRIACCQGTPLVNFSNVTAKAVFDRLWPSRVRQELVSIRMCIRESQTGLT